MKNTPEFKLWLQVMRQGLADLEKALSGEALAPWEDEIDLEELRAWVFEAQGPGSFEWLCDIVDVDAGRARQVIRSYWSGRLDGERVCIGDRRIVVTNGRMRVSAARVRTRPQRGPGHRQDGSPDCDKQTVLAAG